MLTLDERGTEEDEGVGWARDVARAFPATRLGILVGKRLVFGREDVGCGGLKGWRSIFREGSGRNIWCELDCLQGGLYGRGPFQIET